MKTIWEKEINCLKGVGQQRAERYHRLGIDTIGDLLRLYPRSYLDFSSPVAIGQARLNENNVIRATVFQKRGEQRIRKGLSIFKVFVTDEVSDMTITIFNSRFAFEALQVGKTYYFYGKVQGNLIRKEMNSPLIVEDQKVTGMHPVYPLTEGLSNKMVQANLRQALELLRDGEIPEELPLWVREKYKLCSAEFALRQIHFPKDSEHLEIAKKRLVFEEMLTLQLGLLMLKRRNRQRAGVVIPSRDLTPFYQSLPFSLTKAQLRAIEEAGQDLQRPVPMSRLLQGDVGSGKTMVAAALAYLCAGSDAQTAMMAPTEILASQHYQTLSRVLEPLGVSVGLLTGSMSAKQKKEVKAKLLSGEISVITGTHALLQDSTEFHRLGLIITDEQHRFGVEQRSRLVEKGDNPHVLVMSATPIPRTLALMIYGDLDVSVLDELPKGRQKILTYRIHSDKRLRALNFMKRFLDEGKQAYIVCPLVEQEDTTTLWSVEEYAERLKKGPLKGYRVGVLHGKLPPLQKQQVMEEFLEGTIQLLVATTVIEVGVDVPNAVVMMIENAERFGLSQLHQLRGRVGRGSDLSYCILVSDMNHPDNNARLEIMCRTTDGFKISEEDLKLRGPGDFFGERQHGLPQLKIADSVRDIAVLQATQELAKKLLQQDPNLTAAENQGLSYRVAHLFDQSLEHGFQ